MRSALAETPASPAPHIENESQPALQSLALRIRGLRVARGLGVRELATRIGVSPSLISQIERGKGAPSVKTLYALVAALEVPLAQFFGTDETQKAVDSAASSEGLVTGNSSDLIQKGSLRRAIQLEHGFRWERLTRNSDASVEFIELQIAVGGGAGGNSEMKTHQGKEYGVVLEGKLGLKLGFESHVLEKNDSISFESTLPHCMWNAGDVPVRAIWIVIGRSAR
jgi:transcriptional regulator with XRE-family HTH domain